LAAVCEWIVRGGEQARYWESEVTIPCPLIAEIDDSDPQDVRVWGNFWEFSYATRGTTLFCVSGGERPGLLHLRAADSGYEVFNEEMVGDGEAYAKDMRRIFGSIRMIKLDALDREEVRTQYIADYVLQNGLPFTQYQDYGWDPVQLPSAPETPEAAQIARYADPMGWSIDYDLREFSFDGYTDIEMGLSGVGELRGIGIYFERYADTDAETVIAERVQQMVKPEIEEVTIGAEGVPSTMLRDGTTRGEVIKDTYVIALNETDTLAVTVRNTYYAENGDPIVPGADAALEKTLSTFRLTQGAKKSDEAESSEQLQPAPMLEEKEVVAALEKVGLPGIISKEETDSYEMSHAQYVVRSPTETYAGTDNRVFVAAVSAVDYEGEQMLLTMFDQRVESAQIEWEDWKRQIVFATLLYGGFKDEESVYRAFCEKALPHDFEKGLPDVYDNCSWDVQLPEGYCVVSYSHRSQKKYNEDGFEVREHSACMRVNIYESYELFQKISHPNSAQEQAAIN